VIGSAGEVVAYPTDDVWVLEVTRAVESVAVLLDRTVELALAEDPRGVVCSLGTLMDDANRVSLDALASVGRHVRQWPGTPIVIASEGTNMASWLRARPEGQHLMFASSTLGGRAEIAGSAESAVTTIRLPAHPLSARSSRHFLTDTCLSWGMAHLLGAAYSTVHELAAYALRRTDSEIRVSLARHDRDLRLSVRYQPTLDHAGREPASVPADDIGMRLLKGHSHAAGVLPAGDGTRVAWAVLRT
jgi:hypothetical protein